MVNVEGMTGVLVTAEDTAELTTGTELDSTTLEAGVLLDSAWTELPTAGVDAVGTTDVEQGTVVRIVVVMVVDESKVVVCVVPLVITVEVPGQYVV